MAGLGSDAVGRARVGVDIEPYGFVEGNQIRLPRVTPS